MALQFDNNGYLRLNDGCWVPEDFEEELFLVYIEELVIDPPWRGKGVGTSLFSKLFRLEELDGAHFIFVWPTILTYLEPSRAQVGLSGNPTPDEEAALVAKRVEKSDRIIEFYRKVRRLFRDIFMKSRLMNIVGWISPSCELAVFLLGRRRLSSFPLDPHRSGCAVRRIASTCLKGGKDPQIFGVPLRQF